MPPYLTQNATTYNHKMVIKQAAFLLNSDLFHRCFDPCSRSLDPCAGSSSYFTDSWRHGRCLLKWYSSSLYVWSYKLDFRLPPAIIVLLVVVLLPIRRSPVAAGARIHHLLPSVWPIGQTRQRLHLLHPLNPESWCVRVRWPWTCGGRRQRLGVDCRGVPQPIIITFLSSSRGRVGFPDTVGSVSCLRLEACELSFCKVKRH